MLQVSTSKKIILPGHLMVYEQRVAVAGPTEPFSFVEIDCRSQNLNIVVKMNTELISRNGVQPNMNPTTSIDFFKNTFEPELTGRGLIRSLEKVEKRVMQIFGVEKDVIYSKSRI